MKGLLEKNKKEVEAANADKEKLWRSLQEKTEFITQL